MTTSCPERYTALAAAMFTKAAGDPAKLDRVAKGLALAINGNVVRVQSDCYQVHSLDGTHVYDVPWKMEHGKRAWACSCPDFQHRAQACCKHIAAAYLVHKSAEHYTTTAADGTTVLLGNKGIADAQRALDNAAGGFARLACDQQHTRGR